MHCQACGYSLWNLVARECPECGAPFLPGDFEFVPGTVQFCCPHCRHARHGTGDRGHLSPRSFTCEQCDVRRRHPDSDNEATAEMAVLRRII